MNVTGVRTNMIRASALLSRRLHTRGVLRASASGGVRLLARKFATHGIYGYRDEQGYFVEADLSDYMERIGFFGAHSSRLIRYVSSILQPGDWAIDVGANVGLMSSPMARAVGPQGRVWAIEPLARNVERLRMLHDVNGLSQLEVFPTALSSDTSMARLHLSSRPGGSGSGSFVAPWAEKDFVEVPTIALDTLVDERGPDRPLRFIKIDVEGFESVVLRGARLTLARHRPAVMCEFHDALLRAAGSSAAQLIDQFLDCGYEPRPPFGRPSGALDGKVFDMLLSPVGHARGDTRGQRWV